MRYAILVSFLVTSFAQAKSGYCENLVELLGLMEVKAAQQKLLNGPALKSIARRIRQLKSRTGLSERVETPAAEHSLDELLDLLKADLTEELGDEAKASRLAAGLLRRLLAEKQAGPNSALGMVLLRSGLNDTTEQIQALMLWREDIRVTDGWLGAPPQEGNLFAIARLLALPPEEALKHLEAAVPLKESEPRTALSIAAYETLHGLVDFHLLYTPEFTVQSLRQNLASAAPYARGSFAKYLHWYLARKAPLGQIANLRGLRNHLGLD